MNQVVQFDPARQEAAEAPRGRSTLWEMRPQERPYALLNDPQHKPRNRWGQPINLLELNPQWEVNQPLRINGNPEVGCNPNRNKQHAFFFTADNCIGCHACEAACSEKNENPPHIACRSVGYVEGGSYPAYKRLNISMACICWPRCRKTASRPCWRPGYSASTLADLPVRSQRTSPT